MTTRPSEPTDLPALLARHAPQLRQRIAARIPERLRSLLDADDIVQETMTDAFLGHAAFAAGGDGALGGERDGADAFAAWLWTLARHNLVDAVRMLEAHKRGGRRPVAGLPGLDDSAASLAGLLLAASITSPSEQVQRAERASGLLQAIATLPQPHRAVVERHDLRGEPVEAIAQALGRTAGAVYLLRHRAHEWLRQRLLDRNC